MKIGFRRTDAQSGKQTVPPVAHTPLTSRVCNGQFNQRFELPLSKELAVRFQSGADGQLSPKQTFRLEGMKWSDMYFGNAAKAAVRECTEKPRGPTPATSQLAAEPVSQKALVQ